MSTRAILTCLHAYTPFGQIYYEPILDFYLTTMRKYSSEYDMLYLIEDDNWRIDPEKLEGMKAKIVHVDSQLRYYNAFKTVLPQVTEDLVLFMDDDQIIYHPKVISGTFDLLEAMTAGGDYHLWDVVSITDTIGTMKVPLKTGNKLCPYFFASRKELLMKYLDVDWSGDNMPYTETFGLLTEALLKDGAKVHEIEDDKSNTLYDGTKNGDHSKDTGFYHVRGGSTVAYLLATLYHGNKETYDDYLKNQPISELLRHCAWYECMGGHASSIWMDLGITNEDWADYCMKFKEYHGL